MAKQDYSGYIIPVAGVIAVLALGKKLSGAFNFFGDSPDDKANAAIITSASAYFSPNYYKTKSGAVLTTVAYANTWCQTVKDSNGYFNDDEAQVIGAFAQLKYKTQVSWMAERFYILYQKDLLGFLQSFLNDAEMAKISAIVLKLS